MNTTGSFAGVDNVEAWSMHHDVIPPECSWHGEDAFLATSGVVIVDVRLLAPSRK